METLPSIHHLLLFQSSRCAEVGDFTGALRGFSSLLSFTDLPGPIHFAALAARGEVHYNLEHFKRCVDDYDEAEKLRGPGPFPEQRKLRFQRGMSLAALGLGDADHEAANATLIRAVEDLNGAIAERHANLNSFQPEELFGASPAFQQYPLSRRDLCLAYGMRGIVRQRLLLATILSTTEASKVEQTARDLDRLIHEGPFLLRENLEGPEPSMPAAPGGTMDSLTAAFTGVGLNPVPPMASSGNDGMNMARQVLQELSGAPSSQAGVQSADATGFFHPLHIGGLLARSRVCYALADYEGVAETARRYVSALKGAGKDEGSLLAADLRKWISELTEAETEDNSNEFENMIRTLAELQESMDSLEEGG
ncbi:hypothetical protein M427DRAFT_70175 [Gonapodya prolifera JEL478]|uniref:TPR-like protein n=1 Tax=Gonapodya prolifera (strain JEL478) TaxID=1344416 RepID=A0A139AE90_GONPJ|nr:hypothetical protein M427DRAFT_70175 [Gonapodya prolifera JEL478]|eukprot:KXS15078.1 hypothetical protein M427DRAFT_70175 [Gonapodya prolifera JEL478]